MGKHGKQARSQPPDEAHLILPQHQAVDAIVDTHTHLASTFETYRSKYPDGKYKTVHEFFRAMTQSRNVEAIVDVWCEAPVQRRLYKEIADSALTEASRRDSWGNVDYWFVMGVHPHDAKLYDDKVEADIVEAMAHPRCVGWGEMGLDYHYDNSPREIQQQVFIRQLRQAIRLKKPLTIHTREAEEDTERILKAEVPTDHPIHIHCFTDSPEFAARLLDWFENLYIGITGVITYATNTNTSTAVRQMLERTTPDPNSPPKPLRILLETDGPYMVPSNLYDSFTADPTAITFKPAKNKKGKGPKPAESAEPVPVEAAPAPVVDTTSFLPLFWPKGGRLPLCHTGMIPWTADFVAGVAGEGWDTSRVLRDARQGARTVYGI